MKEHRNEEAMPIGSNDKLTRDPELHHLVTSSLPSPPYDALTLGNSLGLSLLDSNIARLLAFNGSGLQIPIPIPLMNSQIFTIPVSGLSAAAHQTSHQIPYIHWLKEQEERNISGNKTGNIINNNNNNYNTNNNNINNNDHHHQNVKKRGTNSSVIKTNKKNKSPIQNKLISSENHMAIKKDVDDNEDIKPTIMSLDKTSKVRNKKRENGVGQPANNKTNNNNNNGKTQHQQSNQQSKDKHFTCAICKRGFGYKHVLQNHERTHTGEKPYACTVCEKRFTRDHHLKTHMRLHTGEKPYNCRYCDRQFVQVANLRRHVRVHTGEKPYSCEDCPNTFSDSNQLKAHKLIHEGQKPFSCTACNLCFRRRHHLTNHKCMKSNKEFPKSSPDHSSSPPTPIKRERKPQRTRKIVRVSEVPVVETVTSGQSSFTTSPVQTHPEDLSFGTVNGLRDRQFSGSNSSVTSSPSPSSRGSLGSFAPSETGSSYHIEFIIHKERNGTTTAESSPSNNGKNDSDEHPSLSQG